MALTKYCAFDYVYTALPRDPSWLYPAERTTTIELELGVVIVLLVLFLLLFIFR